jgi:hypothetical protein
VFSIMSKTMLNSCISCSKGILLSQERIRCDSCRKWIHVKCISHNSKHYKHELHCNEWFCHVCLASLLPFNHIDDEIEFKNVLFNYATSRPINTFIIKSDSQITPHSIPPYWKYGY